MWYVAHGYFANVNKTSFAYAEHLVHKGVTTGRTMITDKGDSRSLMEYMDNMKIKTCHESST